jgi:type IV secretory pathway VirD2 relaxase
MTLGDPIMTGEHDDFRLWLGRIKTRTIRLPKRKGFIAQVLAAASKHGPGPIGGGRKGGSPSNSTFGRGRVATWQAERRLPAHARRVIVKARVIRQRAGTAALTTHLAYLRRDGVTRDGARGELFDAVSDTADRRAFAARTEGDRHHFRFVVSPEDAADLTDLRAYTRDLMDQMARDLGTRLDWVAVDHWNTDNPHVHIVVRGRADDGGDLVISRDYISQGMRARAADLATLELGPQSEAELHRKLAGEVGAERWTRLDGTLQRVADGGGIIDLRPSQQGQAGEPFAASVRPLMIGRLQRLERMGLARPAGAGRWRLAAEAEPTLRALGERGDIVRTMQRAFTAAGRERGVTDLDLHDGATPPAVVGQVEAKGLADELAGTGHLVVDGVDGRGHYVRVPSLADVDEVPVGAVVAVGPARTRPADRTIAVLADEAGGVYQPERHRARLVREASSDDPDAIVEAHVRRLEALRRRGLVERQPDGGWLVPADFSERVQADELRRGAASKVEVRVLSALPLERQVTANGSTWLDRELVARERLDLTEAGFGREVREALGARAEHLVGQGLARRQGQRLILARDLLATLERRELDAVAKAIAADTGLSHHGIVEGERVRGIYRRRLDLVSGRYALIDDGQQFVLVPWRPVIERDLGREVDGLARATGVSWSFGRERGLGL